MNPPTSEGECVWHGITPSLFVLGVFGLTALLSAVIPGPEIKGYATDKRVGNRADMGIDFSLL